MRQGIGACIGLSHQQENVICDVPSEAVGCTEDVIVSVYRMLIGRGRIELSTLPEILSSFNFGIIYYGIIYFPIILIAGYAVAQFG
jgi:hypothetical protein